MNQEQKRLAHLFQTEKISATEFKLLTNALTKKISRWPTIFDLLFNPFPKLTWVYAIVAGLFVVGLMSQIALIASINFPGILDYMIISSFRENQYTVLVVLKQIILSWLILSITFILAAKICRQKMLRAMDFFGMVLAARYPYLIITSLLALLNVVIPHIVIKVVDPHTLAAKFLLLPILIGVGWQVVTYFYALKEASGMLGKKLWISFIVSLIIGEYISVILIFGLLS